ncbi:MAG TPA: MarR family transcriptional regulator [Candidatus Kapabacteria bacterium]|nr:MarR family transcriptional regulator [Candidatus Kapabacteria bacterium]
MGEVLKKRLRMSGFESPAQEAMLALMVTASELRSNVDRVLSEASLTGEQFNILRILRGAGEEGHPSGEIGCRMIDRSPDVTRRIDTLEKQGLVERERSAGDRRVVRVRITEKGHNILDAITPKLHEFESKISAGLTEAELHQLATLCEKMIYTDSNASECEPVGSRNAIP